MIFIYNLADLLKSMKKFEEAEELFREELTARNLQHIEHFFIASVLRFPEDGVPLAVF